MKLAPLLVVGGVGLAAAAVALPMALAKRPEAPAQSMAAGPKAPVDPNAELPPDHPPIPGQQALPADHPPRGAAPAGAVEIRGKVVEVLDVPSYTYVRLETTTEGELWAAIPKTEIKVGEEIGLTGTSRMDGFESPSLKRRFDKLVFANVAR